MIAGMKLQKIDHVTEVDAVIQISKRTCQDQGQRTLQESPVYRISKTENNHCGSRSTGNQAKKQGFKRRADQIQNSEGNSSISYIRNVE